MGAQDLSPVTVARKPPGLFGGRPEGPTVVWMRGEHDASSAERLTQVIAAAIAIDAEDVILDLRGVEFLSAATAAIFLRASAFLNARSRSLILRAPRPSASSLLGKCGLDHLVQPASEAGLDGTTPAAALRTWINVPIVDRARREAPAPPESELKVSIDDAAETLPIEAEVRPLP